MAPRRSTLEIAESKLIEYFTKIPEKILSQDQIDKVLEEQREAWRLANSVTVNKLLNFLATKTQLREIQIKFPSTLIPNFNRFFWGDPSPLA